MVLVVAMPDTNAISVAFCVANPETNDMSVWAVPEIVTVVESEDIETEPAATRPLKSIMLPVWATNNPSAERLFAP